MDCELIDHEDLLNWVQAEDIAQKKLKIEIPPENDIWVRVIRLGTRVIELYHSLKKLKEKDSEKLRLQEIPITTSLKLAAKTVAYNTRLLAAFIGRELKYDFIECPSCKIYLPQGEMVDMYRYADYRGPTEKMMAKCPQCSHEFFPFTTTEQQL